MPQSIQRTPIDAFMPNPTQGLSPHVVQDNRPDQPKVVRKATPVQTLQRRTPTNYIQRTQTQTRAQTPEINRWSLDKLLNDFETSRDQKFESYSRTPQGQWVDPDSMLGRQRDRLFSEKPSLRDVPSRFKSAMRDKLQHLDPSRQNEWHDPDSMQYRQRKRARPFWEKGTYDNFGSRFNQTLNSQFNQIGTRLGQEQRTAPRSPIDSFMGNMRDQISGMNSGMNSGTITSPSPSSGQLSSMPPIGQPIPSPTNPNKQMMIIGRSESGTGFDWKTFDPTLPPGLQEKIHTNVPIGYTPEQTASDMHRDQMLEKHRSGGVTRIETEPTMERLGPSTSGGGFDWRVIDPTQPPMLRETIYNNVPDGYTPGQTPSDVRRDEMNAKLKAGTLNQINTEKTMNIIGPSISGKGFDWKVIDPTQPPGLQETVYTDVPEGYTPMDTVEDLRRDEMQAKLDDGTLAPINTNITMTRLAPSTLGGGYDWVVHDPSQPPDLQYTTHTNVPEVITPSITPQDLLGTMYEYLVNPNAPIQPPRRGLPTMPNRSGEMFEGVPDTTVGTTPITRGVPPKMDDTPPPFNPEVMGMSPSNDLIAPPDPLSGKTPMGSPTTQELEGEGEGQSSNVTSSSTNSGTPMSTEPSVPMTTEGQTQTTTEQEDEDAKDAKDPGDLSHIDLDILARQLLPFVKQKLAIERERHTMR